MNRLTFAMGGAAVVSAAGVFVWSFGSTNGDDSLQPSGETLALGREVYEDNCASCHGGNLEGQPNWKSALPSGRMPAPPHDASGHTWHHPDAMLFRVVEEGTASIVGGDYESDMPGFADILTDKEISAVLEFIKSTWPERERTAQSEMSRREEEQRQ